MDEFRAYEFRRDPLTLAAAACLLAAFAVRAFAGLQSGGLSLDEASTFLIAARPWRDVLTLPVTFHAQPPSFYLVLHAWIGRADSEPWLRLLPSILVAGAALTVLATPWLTPAARVITAGLLLLSDYGLYLAGLIRPYALEMWLALGSTLLFWSIVVRGAHSVRAHTAFVVVTALMLSVLTMGAGLLLSEGACLAIAIALAWRRDGIAAAFRQHGRTVLALAIIGLAFLPYAIAISRLNADVGHTTIQAQVAAALNPRYFVSGPLYLLAMPRRLGLAWAAAALSAVGVGLLRRDAAIGLLCAIIAVQIAMTHGMLEGRSAFAFRYLAPAYPAACLLAGIGAAEWLRLVRRRRELVAIGAAFALGGAIVGAHETTVIDDAPRQVARDLRSMPGPKIVFFEIGWEAQPFAYEVRHDPDVRVMSNPGAGWGAGGSPMTADYVGGIVERESGAPVTFFYETDPASPNTVFATAFVPAMAHHGCDRTYDRVLAPDARFVGYACHGR